MNCHNIISNLSKNITGEEFIDNFLMPDESGKLYFNLNDVYKLDCPDDLIKETCNNNCYDCWMNGLKNYGFKFKSNEIEDNESKLEVIDISIKLTISEVLNKLNEDNTKVFYSNDRLYFLKETILKSCSYSKQESLTPSCDEVVINHEILNQTFYSTNKKINIVISQIKHDEVNSFLLKGFTLIYVFNDRGWTMWYEDNVISYSSGNFDPSDPKYNEYLLMDMLNSHVLGKWFITDSTNQ